MSQGHYHNVKLRKSKHIDTIKKCNYLRNGLFWTVQRKNRNKNTAGNFIWPSEYYKNEKAFIFRLWRIIWHLLLRAKMLFTLSRNLSTMIYLMGLWHNNLLYTGFITKFLMLLILSFKMKEQLCNEIFCNNVMEYLFQNSFHILINPSIVKIVHHPISWIQLYK